MWSLISGAAEFCGQNPWLAVAVVFVAAIVEATAVLGILVPGTPIVMAVAGAAAMAGLPAAPIIAVSILGAILGDGLSYWIGRRYSHRLRGLWPLATRPHLMRRAEAFFARYGSLSVALCRFIPVLRSTLPLAAGMAKMDRQKFFTANVCSAFVWAPAHVVPAQFAGMSLERIGQGDWSTAAWLGAAMAGGLLLLWAAHRSMHHGFARLGIRPLLHRGS